MTWFWATMRGHPRKRSPSMCTLHAADTPPDYIRPLQATPGTAVAPKETPKQVY